MTWISRDVTCVKGNILRDSPIAESVQNRARQVGDLLRERRRLALAFKRTHEEAYGAELQEMDRALARFRIDIPAITERLAVRKG